MLLEALERQRDFLVCSSQLVRGPAHGYELLEQLPELIGERMDTGNLYRFLRLLEAEGIVRSQWEDDVAGPSKRTYELTRPRQDGEKPQAPVALRSRLS